jgi:HlyD family secretion protein
VTQVLSDRTEPSRAAAETGELRPAPSEAPPSPNAQTVGRTRRRLFRAVPALLLASVAGAGATRFYSVPAECGAELMLQGNVDVRQVNLAFKVPGRIETLAFDEGDRVKAGQVMAAVDERYFEDDLRLARAARDQAAANLERLTNGSRPEEIEVARALEGERLATRQRAEQDFRRTQRLIATGAQSRQDFDQAQAAHLEADARLKSAVAARRLSELGPRKEEIAAGKAQLDAESAKVIMSERNLADARLRAPEDGVVLTRAREKGAVVQAGETVFSLTLSSPVWIRTYVGEPDLGYVQPGAAVTVVTDAASGRSYPGHVGFVSPLAEFTPKTVETRELRTDLVYRLRIVVDNPDDGLRQGMPVTARLQLPGTRKRTFWERLLEAVYLDKLVGTGNG